MKGDKKCYTTMAFHRLMTKWMHDNNLTIGKAAPRLGISYQVLGKMRHLNIRGTGLSIDRCGEMLEKMGYTFADLDKIRAEIKGGVSA